MSEKEEMMQKIGALEKKVRQHQRIITLCVITVVVLILNVIAIQVKTSEIIHILDKVTQVIFA